MKNLLKLILFCCFGLSVSSAGFSQDINFQFRDTSSTVNTFIDIPIKATTTLTGRGVLSYSLQFTYQANYLSIQGVETTGTISNAFGTPTVNTSVPGVITIAGAGTSPLTGAGNFIFIKFKVVQAGNTYITNTGVNNNYFNEGDPVLVFQNSCLVNCIGLPVVTVSPATALMLKGETLQFSATGGAVPYTWSSSNNIIASIATSGLLTTTGVGFTNVNAVDANGYTGQERNIEIRGFKLSIPDTTGLYNSYIKIPVRVSDLAGLDILSGTFNISYNQMAFTDISIDTAASILQTVSSLTINLSTPGTIQLSFAGSTFVTGAGVLFWIRGKLSNPAGSGTAFTFQNALLNQDLVAIIKNGSVNYIAPPAISISPNTGQLVYGDSLQFTVSGVNATTPFSWSVSDPSLATVNANRYLKVTRSGQVTVNVIDANSATATTGIFQLYDSYLKISDATAISGEQIEIPVTIKTLPLGQNVFSMQGKIFTSNPALFTITDIIITGTAAASFSVSKSVGTNYIQFAIAGTTAIPGNSILFKVKGTLNNTAPLGPAATLSFQDLLLNEGTPFPLMQNGLIVSVNRYTFLGNGNWDVASNWINNLIPPANVPVYTEIIIDTDTNGECILNVPQQLASGANLIIKTGKKLKLTGNLIIR